MRFSFIFCALCVLLGLSSSTARAQMDVGTNRDLFGQNESERQRDEEKKRREERSKKLASNPFAEALYEEFPLSDWAAMKVSTSATTAELSKPLRGGVFRQELVLLVLAARKSGTPLQKLIDKRENDHTLREIAKDLKLDYDALFDEAAALKEKLDARAASLEGRSQPTAPSASSGTAVSTGTREGP